MAARYNAFGQFNINAMDKPEDKLEFKIYDNESNHSTSTLLKILFTKAETCEEKFKVLDARDKLYKLMQYKNPTLKRGKLLAICPDMCPEKERLLREYQNRGSVFEMTNFSKISGFNHTLAVKEYARSSADQEEPLPHDLRPICVLAMTMSHLLHNVADFCELSDDNLEDWYMFMWDRTRALRKELTQQGICNLESVSLVEQCARFHIHCAERLVDQDSSIYDDKINTENLTKCLQTLKYMYKDLAKEDIKCPNEPEFVCYTLLLNLNNSSVFTELSDMTNSLMTSSAVSFALNVMTAWETKNYIRFFNLVKKGTYLNCCLLRRYFGEMRLYAIKTMIRSYCTKNYSPQIFVSRFVENLNFEGEEECLNFLSHCNFNFHDADGFTIVNFNRLLFQNPQTTLTTGRAFMFIEEKKKAPLSVILAGGTLPPKLFENYIPENSFTENGELKENSLLKMDFMEFSSGVSTNTIPSANLNLDKLTTANINASVFKKEKSAGFFLNPELKEESEDFSTTSGPLFTTKEAKHPAKTNLTSIFGHKPDNSHPFPDVFQKNLEIECGPSLENKFTTSLFTNQTPFPIISTSPSASTFISLENKTTSNFSVSQLQKNENDFVKPVLADCISSDVISEPAQMESGWNTDFKQNTTKFEYDGFPIEYNNLSEKQSETLDHFDKEKNEEISKKRKRVVEEEKSYLSEKKMNAEENKERKVEGEEMRKEYTDISKNEGFEIFENVNKKLEEEMKKEEKLGQKESEVLKLIESKRKAELEIQKIEQDKLNRLKKKIVEWKMKIVFDIWRMKTWCRIEDRKMRDYYREIRLKYPPVCSEELLNGNPYGLVIPNTLALQQFQNFRKEFRREKSQTKKLFLISDDLPLLKLNQLLGKRLELRAKKLGWKLKEFHWKVVISIPDVQESPRFWKSIETFVEMHFVTSDDWEFGSQNGPLYCCMGTHKSFKFYISVRRLRGCQLYEGDQPNPSAVEGCNSIIFILTEWENPTSRKRLKTLLKAKNYYPKVPVIVFLLNDNCQVRGSVDGKVLMEMETLQKFNISELYTISTDKQNDNSILQLIESLYAAVDNSSAPSTLRINNLSDFLRGNWFDSLWRRLYISLSTYNVILNEPKVLIDFFNSSLEKLSYIFLDQSYDQHSLLPQEFSEIKLSRPIRTSEYAHKLNILLQRFKLPQWPMEIPKTTHQLNHRIHQYCKKIVTNDRLEMKNLKWAVYRIIRRSLLWKGLDIYCEEDVHEILVKFPWIQVFREITRFMINHHMKNKENLTVMYDLEKVERFTFETNLIGKLLSKSGGKSKKRNYIAEEESEETTPNLENDSIVYAYSSALKKESVKRKREESADKGDDSLLANLNFPLEEHVMTEAEPMKSINLSQLRDNFQSLNDQLDRLKVQSLKNASILTDIQHELQ